MPSSQNAERRREPAYVDDYDGRRPPPERRRPRRYEDDFPPRDRRPRRRRSYRDMRSSSPSSSSPPPPPRHQRPRREEPRSHKYDPYESYDDYPRRRPRRDEGYLSDNRHNRPRRGEYRGGGDRPPRDEHRHRERRDREGGGRPRERPGPPERKESRWQKEARDMFKEYAVPAIKAEGGKYISKQIGNMIAKQAH